MSNTVQVTDSSFADDVLTNDKPVLVDSGRPGAVRARWSRQYLRRSRWKTARGLLS